ncbi:hypothetical protein [Rhodanobacter sp. L36]|uniref:hypothetical protein n=1 Tax=Rhodanobacter sp. L36 TaxID=1747221 RepID=UPI00131BDE89|nr:hypothetical protein [Rhodanobacter sp. L36]
MSNRTLAACLLALTFSIGIAVNASTSAMPTQAQPTTAHDGSKDFDGLHGHWIVHNRKLAKRLAGSTTWIPFDATDEFQPLPGGLGLQEHYRTSYWKNFEALSFNLYDPQTQQWTLYWVDNFNLPITLQPPLVGKFSGNTGDFEGPDTFGGKPILVRHIWKLQDKNHVAWEQAFSVDHGASWETNWTMEFVRQ